MSPLLFTREEDWTVCGLWDPVVGRASSRCLRLATVAPSAAVPAVGRYTTPFRSRQAKKTKG
ncbi:hypothetical protein ACLOJK_007560 [Asimina triloba]